MEDNSQQPLVSIIIPTYGGRSHLADSVKSALTQTYGNVEVIVVDDNNPDTPERKRTEELINKYTSNHLFKYIRHEKNRNGAAARNTGIKVSSGELIAFLDDDDCFLPEKISRQVDYLSEHPEYQAAYCLASKNGINIPTVPYEGDVSLHLLMGESNMFTPTLIFRREAIEALNGFDESYRRHQDYELLLRFFEKGYRIGCFQKILTDLGHNEGENSPHGDKLELLKANFFEKFSSTIDILESQKPGTKKDIYAIHYSKVFIDHIKTHHWLMAWRILGKYGLFSPSIFAKQIYKTAIHLLFNK